MTERPEGTPAASPDEPEAAPEAETETGAPEARAAAAEELTAETVAYDPERDAAEVDEIEDELDAEAGEDEGVDDELEEETVVPLGVEPAGPLVTATGAAVPRRRQTPPPSVQRAPTQSELAVRVTDNLSRVFVIGTVAVFVAILAWGLLGGSGGILTATPAPTATPSVSAAPSESLEASASPS
jgi:hypothetical protein